MNCIHCNAPDAHPGTQRLEHDICRARRCIAAERLAREQRVNELKSELRASNFGVTTLCRIAFGKADG